MLIVKYLNESQETIIESRNNKKFLEDIEISNLTNCRKSNLKSFIELKNSIIYDNSLSKDIENNINKNKPHLKTTNNLNENPNLLWNIESKPLKYIDLLSNEVFFLRRNSLLYILKFC